MFVQIWKIQERSNPILIELDSIDIWTLLNYYSTEYNSNESL